MADFGVTPEGFVVKGLDTVLAEAVGRARQAFGADVDLSPTSPLLKILQVTAAEDALLWQCLEDLYYSRFVSTAVGGDLDLLGEDLGVARRHRRASGEVTFTVSQAQPGRRYTLPAGTVVVTDPPVRAFHTTAAAHLDTATTDVTVAAVAFDEGPDGDVPAAAITGIDPDHRARALVIGPPATIAVTNAAPFTGGAEPEPEEDYRDRLLGRPRNLWTLDAARAAVLDVPGVTDALLTDLLGGVDVSQSYFNLFAFGRRRFSGQPRPAEPYFFDVVVAHDPYRPWRTEGAVTGVLERVTDALDRVRPAGVHPNVVQADHIDVGVRAEVVLRPGYDEQGTLAALLSRVAAGIGRLRLGGDVLYSQVMRAFAEQPGVIDVRGLRLRRCAPVFGRIGLGSVAYQEGTVEAAAGESLIMGPREIAVFQLDSALIDVAVSAP
ncbi:hypothetical protein HII36_08770 [Nonomuraea sp. NN258]|uniref:baseplate J/gp47 family protein n=1 Tax=Nonomuraea antri TaxID=2730852 RepID=UPI0015684DDC|nr:baseplate J/gp47 family protein [Nonomuraea antri]NRQ31931.1 hypothetical protein [Nonomuraea antri]